MRTIHIKGLVLTFEVEQHHDLHNKGDMEELAREIVRRVEVDLKVHAGEMADNIPFPSMDTGNMRVRFGPRSCDLCGSESRVKHRTDPLAHLDRHEDWLDLCDSCIDLRNQQTDPPDWAYPSDDYDYPAYHDCDPVDPQIQLFSEDDQSVLDFQGTAMFFPTYKGPRR